MERRAKGSGLFGEPNCHIPFAWVRSLRSDQQRFRRCGRRRERRTALGLGAPQRSNVRQQNVNDESHFNARPRASAARDQIRQGVKRPIRSGRAGQALSGAAELCDVYCRKSSEMRFTEAAFSVAKTVLPSDLAM
jgi:hypothetical protein